MKFHPGALLVLTALALSSCFGGGSDSDSNGSGKSSPYRKAADYARDHSGVAVLVVKGNEIVHEEYFNGGAKSKAYPIYSGSKAFNCAIAIAAIQEGRLSGFDENVSQTLTEWAADPLKSLITVRQLLDFTSGLRNDSLEFAAYTGNKYLYALAQPVLSAPGTAFQYGETHLTVFSELMRRKLLDSGEDPLAFLKRTVLDPIGMSYAEWDRDGAGNPLMSFGAHVTAREYLKYGKLLRATGSFGGSPILDADLLEECFTPGQVMPAYGLTFWLNAPLPIPFSEVLSAIEGDQTGPFSAGGPNQAICDDAPDDLVMIGGMRTNRLYFSRSEDIIIVKLAEGSYLSSWKDAEFLSLVF